jgi:hypothetical protein
VGVWVVVGLRVGVEVNEIVLVGSVNCVRVGKAEAPVGFVVGLALPQPKSKNNTNKVKM